MKISDNRLRHYLTQNDSSLDISKPFLSQENSELWNFFDSDPLKYKNNSRFVN